MTVRIVTDSACDLSAEECEAYGIDVVPLSIRFGDQVFLDRDELGVDDFYRLMASSEDLPQTAAPAPGARPAARRAAARPGRAAAADVAIAQGPYTASYEYSIGPRKTPTGSPAKGHIATHPCGAVSHCGGSGEAWHSDATAVARAQTHTAPLSSGSLLPYS